MKLKTFIDRSILSCVISVLILMLGIIGLTNLPMEQYPDIAPPTITVYFSQGTDPDMATINTKNRVSEAEGVLPAEVTKIGVTVEKRQNSMVKILALYSEDDSYDQNFVNNYFR